MTVALPTFPTTDNSPVSNPEPDFDATAEEEGASVDLAEPDAACSMPAASEPAEPLPPRLEGDALLTLIADQRAAGNTNANELATLAGYVNGKGKPALTDFYQAKMKAEGFDTGKPKSSKKGKGLSYSFTVGPKGQIVVGGGYSAPAGFNPGDTGSIKVDGSTIVLTKA